MSPTSGGLSGRKALVVCGKPGVVSHLQGPRSSHSPVESSQDPSGDGEGSKQRVSDPSPLLLTQRTHLHAQGRAGYGA